MTRCFFIAVDFSQRVKISNSNGALAQIIRRVLAKAISLFVISPSAEADGNEYHDF